MILKSEKEMKTMREGGKILAEIMEELKKASLPVVTTESLNDLAEKLIEKAKGKPSFKGHKGFPAALCTSVNEVIVHDTPSQYVLKEGDILSLDVGILYKKFHTDMAVTVPIGNLEGEKMRLIRETKKALKRGIKKTRVGNTIGDVGNTIERHVRKSGFFIVEGLCGHGIGREIHEDPQVFNEGKRGKGVPLEVGMVICIEPMLSMGSGQIESVKGGTGFKTVDNSLSAHFEHTIAITEKGTFVLTEV